MIKYFADGSNIQVRKLDENSTFDKLPPKIYSIGFNQMTGFYLSKTNDKFETPQKVYGKVKQRVQKIIKKYDSMVGNTGVLMTGDKGTGKSLLLSLLGNELLERGLPVIIVSTAYHGDVFIDFVNMLGECVIIFDEFAKVYRDESNSRSTLVQEELLTLFDGVIKQKRLTLVVDNDIESISQFFKGRPSRLIYDFRYGKLDEDTITEICVDNSIDEKTINDIISISREMKEFSTDVLKTIIDEYKLLGEDVGIIIKDLNIGYDPDKTTLIEVLKVIDTETNKELKVKLNSIYHNVRLSSPDYGLYLELKGDNEIGYKDQTESSDTPPVPICTNEAGDPDDEDWESFHVYKSDIKYSNTKKSELVFERYGYAVLCKVHETTVRDFSQLGV